MDTDPGAPDPLEEEPRPAPSEPVAGDWDGEDEGHDGPFFAWLPPEDRLWRHPSERAAAGPDASVLVADRDRARARTVIRTTWAVALIAGLIGATAATGVGLATGLWPHNTTLLRSVVPSTSSVSLAAVGSEPTNWTAIDDSVAASVVTVSVQGAAGPQIGSGIVFPNAGDGNTYIVADRSLFARDEAAGYLGAIDVTFLAGPTLRARLLGDDSLSGLAVVQISAPVSAAAVNMGSIADVHEADQVIAVGSRAIPSVPTGVSTGTVNGEDRTVMLPDGSDLDGLMAIAVPSVASTAAGGPVLNQFGQVVGVTLSLDPVNSGDQPFTFAVPIDEVTRVASQIIERTPLTHPWLGVRDAEDLPTVTAHQLGVLGGVQVGSVEPSSPAGQAGLRSSDVITAFDGKPVSSTGALMAAESFCLPGKAVQMTFIHSGRTVNTVVKMGEEPADE